MKTMLNTLIAIALVAVCFMLGTLNSIAQSGQSCNTAKQNYSKDTCAYQSWVISGTEYWFYFKANTPYVYISVITTKFGINAPHVHRVELIDGTCSTPVVIADDELPFVDYWDELRIDLDASGLIPGNKYYIRLLRQPSGGKLCDKSTCRAMIQPAGFDICIQDVDVFIPLDFGIEPPSQSHSYIQNKGQIIDTDGNPRPDIVMVAPNAYPSVYVANTAIHYVFSKIDTSIATIDTLHRIDMTLENANPKMRAFKTEQAQGRFNYFLPQTPNGVSSKPFSRLVWNEVYPKIDMQFYSNYNGLKLYFIVRQGGDAEDIEMKIDGASQLIVTPDSGIEIVSSLGKLQFEPGHAYQINPAGNIVPMPWQAKFIKTANNKVKFDIRKYPKNMPLIIQVDKGHDFTATQAAIKNFEWCSYYGGSDNDYFNKVITDDQGNSYFVGTTRSKNDFPVSLGPTTVIGYSDATFVKFDANAVPQYAILFGSSGSEKATSIALSPTGNIFFCGQTTRLQAETDDFPVQYKPGAYIDSFNTCTGFSCKDIFIVEFKEVSQYNIQREWASLYGGDIAENSYDMDIDKNGNIYIVGSGSIYSPLQFQPGAYNNDTVGSGLMLKFSSSDSLLWATLIGSNYGTSNLGDEIIAVDIAGQNRVYITGIIKGTGLPVVNPPFNSTFMGGASDAFITIFDTLNTIFASSYYGGSGIDAGKAITASEQGRYVLVTGATISTNNMIRSFGNAFVDSSFNGGSYSGDLFLLAIDKASGYGVWATYWGAASNENPYDIVINADDTFYITGWSQSTNLPFPANPPADFYVDNTNSGQEAAFILAFDRSFNPFWLTLVEGKWYDLGFSLALSESDNKLYFTGSTTSAINDAFPLIDLNPLSSLDWFEDDLNRGAGPPNSTDGYVGRFSVKIIPASINKNYNDILRSILVYPNPATQTISIQTNNIIEIIIYDIAGNIISSVKYRVEESINEQDIDLTHLSSGIYILKIQTEKLDKTVKIIKY